MTQLAFRAIVSAWLLAAAVWDRVEGRVPNALVLPPLVGVLGWRIYRVCDRGDLAKLAGLLLGWGLAYGLWRLRIWGAGDAKLVMVLCGLFPTLEFALLLALVIVLCNVPRLIARRAREARHVRKALCVANEGSKDATQPPRGSRSHADAWVLALAGVLYVWCVF